MTTKLINWRTHINPNHRTDCMLIGKGPTAVEARRNPFGSLIVLNDAAILFPETIVDVMVCDSVISAMKCKSDWWRIRLSLFPVLQDDHHEQLAGIGSYGSFVETETPQTFEQNLTAKKLSNMTTATSALCLLVRSGFKRIWCFGHDGGKKRAEGLEQHHRSSGTYDRKTDEMKRCVEVVRRTGVDVRFWPESFYDYSLRGPERNTTGDGYYL